MGQRTITLANAGLSEMAVAGAEPLPPSHDCEGKGCSMVNDCEWVRRWRREVNTAVSTSLPRVDITASTSGAAR